MFHSCRSFPTSRRAICSFTLLAATLLVSSINLQAQAPQANSRALALTNQLLQARGTQGAAVAQLAAQRQAELSALLSTNPAEALRLAFPASVRNGYSPDVQALIEQEQDADGELQVEVEDAPRSSTVHYFLQTQRERMGLYFAADAPTHVVTGAQVHVHGVRFASGLALSSGSNSGSFQALSSGLSNTLGAQNTLLVLVNFQDAPSQPYSTSYAYDVVFNTTSNFDLENSFQQTWLTGTVAGWFTIPVSSGTCDTTSIANYGKQAAANAGYNLSNYSRFVFAFPQNACGWWGYSYVGGNPSTSWVNGSLQLMVVGHEMGHAFGLYHSHSLNCGSVSYTSSGCSSSDYGDYYDIMGNSNPMHFNSFQKERLGWLNAGSSPPIQAVSSSGTYQLAPYESQDTGAKALKILQSSSSYYYVEFRQGLGFDYLVGGNANVLNGVVVHFGNFGGVDSWLLNMNPASGFGSAMALDVGQSYTDTTTGVTIAPISVGSTASVQVTFAAKTCTPAAPAVSISPSQTQYVSSGTTVNFTVSVTDRDSSGCSAATYNLGNAVPSGWSGSLGNAAVNLMPGGSASVQYQVTSPSGTPNGMYNVSASATNASLGTYSNAGSATYAVSNPLPVTLSVSTDKASYSNNQNVTVTVRAMSGSVAAGGVPVTATIAKPNGSVVTLSGTTGTSGAASMKYHVAKADPKGTYQVNAAANGASASTSFSVQ